MVQQYEIELCGISSIRTAQRVSVESRVQVEMHLRSRFQGMFSERGVWRVTTRVERPLSLGVAAGRRPE